MVSAFVRIFFFSWLRLDFDLKKKDMTVEVLV